MLLPSSQKKITFLSNWKSTKNKSEDIVYSTFSLFKILLSAIGDLYIWGWNESGQLGFPTKNDKTSPDAQCTSQGESLEAADNLDSSRMKTTLEEGCSRRAHPQETDSKPESAKKMRFSDSVESADMSKEQLHECGGVVRSTTDTDDNNGMYKGQLENASTATQISLTTLDVLHEDVSKTSDEMRRQSTQSQDISQQKAFSTTLGRFNKDPVRDQSREQIANREVHLGSESKEDTAGDRWDGDEGGGSDVVLIQALPAILDLPDGKDVSRVSCGSRHTAAISGGHLVRVLIVLLQIELILFFKVNNLYKFAPHKVLRPNCLEEYA